MSLKKLVVSSVAALSILGSTAFAANNAAGAKLATDGTGDYLVFPVYFATTSGWKTNLRVVNTNPTDAIVAKVVIREYKTCAEKLDFPIYLSPGDVWEASLETDEDGNVVLVCNDDSMFLRGVPANKNTIRQALFQPQKFQDNRIGYVEVYGVAQISASDMQKHDEDKDGKTWNGIGTPLDKDDLFLYYKTTLNGQGNNPNGDWKGVDTDSLYGQEVIFGKNQYGELAMTLTATAFEGVTGKEANSNKIIGADTTPDNVIIPDNTNKPPKQAVMDVLKSIAEALRKTHIYVTYYDDGKDGVAETRLYFTQPLKHFLLSSLSQIGYSFDPTRDGDKNINSLLDYYFTYNTTPRDMEEHSPKKVEPEFSGNTQTPKVKSCNTEICIWDMKNYTDYTNGYVDFDLSSNVWFNNKKGIAGIPVLMTAKNVSDDKIVTNAIFPAYKK